MAKKTHTNYTVENLLEDREFVRAIKSIRTNEEWEQFLRSYPGSENTILRTRRIIQLFETTEGRLQDEKKYKLWKDINSYNREFKRTVKLTTFKTFTRIAASILIILSLGSLLYLGIKKQNDQYHFTQNVKNLNNENPVLVLSDGKTLELRKNDSEVAVLKDRNAIQVNNDSIIKIQQPVDKDDEKIVFNEMVVPFGSKSSLVLEDGTKVWLNAGSRFAFPQKFSGKKREVFLEGEAYFEVAKNENQPFIVNTNDVDLEVLGTKFNISAYSADNFCETVLLEGSVNVWEKGKLFREKVQMAPNQKATFSKESKEITLNDEPACGMYIAWIDGWYQFSNENLEQVLKKLERYYNVSFEYNQSLITKALPVSGKLELKRSLSDVLPVLFGVAKIDFLISEEKVILLNK